MKLESLLLMITTKTPIELGESGAIKMDLINQFHLVQNEDGDAEIDGELAVDVENIFFLGVKIPDGYKEYQTFKQNISKLGLNVDELVEKEIEKIDIESIKKELKQKYGSIFKL